MNKTLYVLLAFGLFFYSCTENKQGPKNSLSSRLDSLIIHEHEAGNFDGTIVIGNQETILYEKAIGTADRVWDISMDLNHRFDICSINKSFIATLVLVAVEEGRLSLDDSLTDLLERFNYSGSFDPDITIHQMLTHTSGLPHYESMDSDMIRNWFRPFKRKHFSNDEYVDFLSSVPPVHTPGEQFSYSSFAYHLLAIILEEVYQTSFSKLLDDKISEPLNLTHTFSTSANLEIHTEMVEAYNYQESSDSWNRNQFIDLSQGNRIFSTAHDLYEWGREMSSPSLLSPEMMIRMQTNHLTTITSDISYGYGWVVFDGQGDYRMGDLGIDKKYIIHGGSTEGFKSMLINIEQGEYIIAFLSNIGDQTNEIELAQKIVHTLITSEHER